MPHLMVKLIFMLALTTGATAQAQQDRVDDRGATDAAAGDASAAQAAPADTDEGEVLAVAVAGPAATMPGLEALVDGMVAVVMANHTLPGATVSVVKDGNIIFLKGYGYADLEKRIKVDPEKSMFRIGSITKTFTGLAVMQLVEQGKLDLDADVNTYLTAFKIPDTFKEPVTLRALLSHRPGFEDSAAGHLFEQNPAEVLEMGEYLARYMPRRVRQPGLTSSYSNYGLALAGYIVEQVSGEDFATYLEAHILQPLGMEYSTVREPLGAGRSGNISAALAPLIATGYTVGPGRHAKAAPFDYIHQVAPAGGISASARDMARYMMARLNGDAYAGGRLVSPATTAQMDQRLYHDRPGTVDFAHTMDDGRLYGYRNKSHTGGTTTFLSNMSMFPELQLGIFISTNSPDGGGDLMSRFPELIVKEYFVSQAVSPPPTPPADFKTRGNKYVGEWLGTRRSYTQLEKLAVLTGMGGITTTTIDDDGYLVMNDSGVSTRWAEVEPGVFQSLPDRPEDEGQMVYFYQDAGGKVVRFSGSANDSERISFFQSPGYFMNVLGLALLLSITTLLGAWRRSGQKSPPGSSGSKAQFAAWIAVLTALLIVGIGICFLLLATGGVGDISNLIFNFPPTPLKVSLWLAIAVVVVTVLLVLQLPSVWKDRHWGLLRRLHYSLFMLVCLDLVFGLWLWNMLGFKYL